MIAVRRLLARWPLIVRTSARRDVAPHVGCSPARRCSLSSACRQNAVSVLAVVSGASTGGRVPGARYADPVGAKPPGHQFLDGRRPRVVVLAVEDQDRRPVKIRELRRTVRAGEQIPAHGHQAGRAVAHHPLVQEGDHVARAVGPGLLASGARPRCSRQICATVGPRRRPVASRVHHGQHAAQHLGALAGDAAGSGAEQGERDDPCRPRQRRLPRDQPAEGVPDQVQALAVPGDDFGDRRDVGGKLIGRVGLGVRWRPGSRTARACRWRPPGGRPTRAAAGPG